jgi:glycosyltransferase involved in cell wall biosynthesis
MDNIGIIIPAYNEERRIGKTLNVLTGYFENLRKQKKLNYEILIVINNTKDRTEEIVKSYEKKNKNIKSVNLVKGGKGFAVMEGFKIALKDKRNFNLIGFIDADLATPPEAFYDLVKNIGNNDGIIASRYINGAIIEPKPSILRKLASVGFISVVRVLFFMPFHDTQCGAKVFTRRAITELVKHLIQSNWAFDVNILYLLHKNGFKIKEIPTLWRDIEDSKLKVAKVSIQMFLAVLQLRIINSPFRRILRPLKLFIGPLWRIVK